MSSEDQPKAGLLNTNVKKFTAFFVSGVAFLGAVTSLLLNASRLGDSWRGETAGALQMLVSTAQTPPPIDPNSAFAQYNVTYKSTPSDDRLHIQASSDYFEPDAKAVGILGEGPYFALPKVGLDLKLVNNSKDAVFLTEAVIEAKTSRADLRPLLAFTHHDGVVGEIEFTNDGWGEPESLIMTAALADEDSGKTVSLAYRTVADGFNGSVRYLFDIGPLLEAYGITSDMIRKAEALGESEDYEAEQAAWAQIHVPCMRAFASAQDIIDSVYFGEQDPAVKSADVTDEQLAAFPYGCTVEVKGTLEIGWQNNQAPQQQTINFKTLVFVSPPEGLGSTGFEPTGEYDVELQTAGDNYSIAVPLSQTVKPQDFDRFMLWIGAPRSSSHDFIVKLKYNQDGEILSMPIQFDYMRPRHNAERAE